MNVKPLTVFQFYKVRLKLRGGLREKDSRLFQFYKVRLKQNIKALNSAEKIISILQSSIKTAAAGILRKRTGNFNSTKFD